MNLAGERYDAAMERLREWYEVAIGVLVLVSVIWFGFDLARFIGRLFTD